MSSSPKIDFPQVLRYDPGVETVFPFFFFFSFFFFLKVIFPRRAGLDRKHNVAYIKSFHCREGKFQEKILVKNPP